MGVAPEVTFAGTDPTKSYTLIMTDPGVLDIKTLRGKDERYVRTGHRVFTCPSHPPTHPPTHLSTVQQKTVPGSGCTGSS